MGNHFASSSLQEKKIALLHYKEELLVNKKDLPSTSSASNDKLLKYQKRYEAIKESLMETNPEEKAFLELVDNTTSVNEIVKLLQEERTNKKEAKRKSSKKENVQRESLSPRDAILTSTNQTKTSEMSNCSSNRLGKSMESANSSDCGLNNAMDAESFEIALQMFGISKEDPHANKNRRAHTSVTSSTGSSTLKHSLSQHQITFTPSSVSSASSVNRKSLDLIDPVEEPSISLTISTVDPMENVTENTLEDFL